MQRHVNIVSNSDLFKVHLLSNLPFSYPQENLILLWDCYNMLSSSSETFHQFALSFCVFNLPLQTGYFLGFSSGCGRLFASSRGTVVVQEAGVYTFIALDVLLEGLKISKIRLPPCGCTGR